MVKPGENVRPYVAHLIKKKFEVFFFFLSPYVGSEVESR